MKKVFSIILIFLSVLLLSSCTAEAVSPDESSVDTWEGIFLQYWNVMNMEYAHFDIETDLDWDAVYEKYLPLFRKLDYSNVNDSLKAFRYFKEIAINIDDGHYDLIIRDNFRNSLLMSPSRERKWAQRTGKSYLSFPDVIWSMEQYGHIVSVDGVADIETEDDEESEAEILAYYEEAVEGYSEVTKLTSANAFHTGKGFSASQGYSFKSIAESDDGTKLNEQDSAWNEVIAAFNIDGFSYYYGVTEDNIFYFYFSSFISYMNTPLSEPLLFREILSEEQRSSLDGNYQKFHDYLWDKSSGYDLTGNIKDIEGIGKMFDALASIGKTGTCTMTNSFGVEETYDIDGVIMDLRSNSGGDNSTLETIFGSFFSSETKFAETKYKDGYSRFEYGPWIDMSIEQSFCTADKDFDKPFVVLTNGNSISCAELSASIAKNIMKNGAVIGGATYGGTYTMAQRSLYHSGTFSSKNIGIQMTTFETRYVAKDGSFVTYEVCGIEPDKTVAVDGTYATDARFASAVRWVNEHKTN